MADTPHGMPVIGAGTTAHIKISALVSLMVALVGGTLWLNNLHNDVEGLKIEQKRTNEKLDYIINTMIKK